MLDVSARWDAAVRTSGVVVARAEVWRSGAPVGVTLNLTGGSVRLDETSNVRRALSCTVSDSKLMPSEAADLLAPTDTDLKVFAGVRYPEGDEELVPVGVFRVGRVSRGSLRSGELDISGGDYTQVLVDARFEKPWNLGPNTSVIGHMRSMVAAVLPWVEFVDLTGSKRLTSPQGGAFERDRWAAIQTLADTLGADAGFDSEGRFVVKPTPRLKTAPDWTIDYGTARAVMLDASVGVSSEGVWNSVTAAGSGDVVVSATWRQTSGVFAWRSGFQRPRFFSSPMLKTAADCQRSAVAILARSGALAEEVAPSCAPNWALDIGDTIGVQMPGRDLLLRILSGATMPLGPGSMSVTTRTVANSDIEGLS